MPTSKNKAKCGTEITYNSAGGSGAYQAFSAALANEPSLIIFDNQSNVDVAISDNGTNTWKTFLAREALVLDLRANGGSPANELSFPIGTQFYANSGAGVGIFRISTVYAQ